LVDLLELSSWYLCVWREDDACEQTRVRVDKLLLIKREYLIEKYLGPEIQHKYTELSVDIAV